MKIARLILISLAYLSGGILRAQDSAYRPLLVKLEEIARFEGQIPGPSRPEDFSIWLADIKHWRQERLVRMGYSDGDYVRPELLWTQRNTIQTLLQVTDRFFYDVESGRYTVDRYLDDLLMRYGGVDSVIIWHHYPSVGVDHRNQFDLLRDMPGGLPALREVVARLHERGVRAFLAVIPWDRGTRDEGKADWDALAGLLAEIGADGVYGDTLNGVPRIWRDAGERSGRVLALEPQNSLLAEALAWNTLTWGEGWRYNFVPSVSHHKWLEPRHMVHIVQRWARDRTDDLQHAFFNGTGYVSWENVWGAWNEISARDAEVIRRTAGILRLLSELMTSPGWEPHTPTLQPGVFASKFPGKTRSLWTLVNRNHHDVSGPILKVPSTAGHRFYNLWNGEEVFPEKETDGFVVDLTLDGRGYGAVLGAEGHELDGELGRWLARVKERARTPLRSLSPEPRILSQVRSESPPTRMPKARPAGMVLIPEGTFYFKVESVESEGQNRPGSGVQYGWETSPRRHHLKKMRLGPFYLDRFPVTNEGFRTFLAATGYRPRDDHNFLKHWNEGTYPAGWENKPVVWVSIEDAKAYAEWAGKRLPREWEWQYAAQGQDHRLYPWGNEFDGTALPPPETGREMRPPTDVGAFPKGASPFGVMDMVGNIWQWTDEYSDEHTRFAILRGGSFYRPQGSLWYFPQALRLDRHGKYLLVAPSRDRSAAIGFRCAADARPAVPEVYPEN